MFSSILQRWRGKKDQAWKHLGDLYRAAFFLLGDRSAAEGLVERAYLDLWKKSGKRRNVTSLKTDLLRCLLAAAEHAPRVVDRAESDALRAPVVACLFELPPELRTVIVLDVIDLDVVEIAAVIGIPAEAVLARQRAGWDLLIASLGRRSPAAEPPHAGLSTLFNLRLRCAEALSKPGQLLPMEE